MVLQAMLWCLKLDIGNLLCMFVTVLSSCRFVTLRSLTSRSILDDILYKTWLTFYFYLKMLKLTVQYTCPVLELCVS